MKSKNGREICIFVSEPLCGRLKLLREIGRPTVGKLTRRSGDNVFLRSWALLYPLAPPPGRLGWPRMMKSQFADCRKCAYENTEGAKTALVLEALIHMTTFHAAHCTMRLPLTDDSVSERFAYDTQFPVEGLENVAFPQPIKTLRSESI